MTGDPQSSKFSKDFPSQKPSSCWGTPISANPQKIDSHSGVGKLAERRAMDDENLEQLRGPLPGDPTAAALQMAMASLGVIFLGVNILVDLPFKMAIFMGKMVVKHVSCRKVEVILSIPKSFGLSLLKHWISGCSCLDPFFHLLGLHKKQKSEYFRALWRWTMTDLRIRTLKFTTP